jgi:hypothetical protein
MDIVHADKWQNVIQDKNSFRYGIPAYTSPFFALGISSVQLSGYAFAALAQ